MQININTPVPADDPDTSVLPATLKLPAVPRLAATRGLPPRDVVALENMVPGLPDPLDPTLPPEEVPGEVLLNGYHFMDDTTDFIKEGTTETWQWINLTVDAHPMHPHLVASQVVNRQQIDVEAYVSGLACLSGL